MRRAAAKPAEPLAEATVSEADGVRYLHLGTPWVQGAMRIRKPDAIELEYVQRMMAWTLLRPADDVAEGHAMQLGLGAGAITRFCTRVMSMRSTAVELNPSVIAACRAWFRLPPDGADLQVLQADAGAVAADPARAGSVQALCVDLYDHEAAGPVLDSIDFYRGCRRLLAADGVMSVNLFGRAASFEASAARIAEAFAHTGLWQLRPTRQGNTVVLAAPAAPVLPVRDVLAARADNIETRFALPARKWLRMLRPLATAPTAPADTPR